MPADTVPPFIQSVVHPTDLSAASQRAFAHALAVALVRRARLTLLHVDADDDRPDWSEFPAVRTTLERLFEVLRGSTTERVLRQAPCPLLAVPASSGT
jgi:nucleotide-binding universal stress UspA family protein